MAKSKNPQIQPAWQAQKTIGRQRKQPKEKVRGKNTLGLQRIQKEFPITKIKTPQKSHVEISEPLKIPCKKNALECI